MHKLQEREWRRLVMAIKQESCVILLGPDVSFDPDDPTGPTLSTKLAHHLANDLSDGTVLADKDNLAHVAQLFDHQERSHALLEDTVVQFYKAYDGRTSEFHEALARLPVSMFVTTTHDRLLHSALSKKEVTAEHYDFRNARPAPLRATARQPVLYGLYGSPDEPQSMVLTENDLLEFLAGVVKGTPPLPGVITSKFADPNTSFLFLGFGFASWHVRILLHVLQAQGHRERSLAIESERFFQHPDRQLAAVFFDRDYSIEFQNVSCFEFAAELSARAGVDQASVASASKEVVDAPRVFLCYCDEDRDRVEEIEQSLQSHGINTWRDKQQLRGGVRWDKRLRRVLDHVDYVVVFQSSAMRRRIETYCGIEIEIALEREPKFALNDFRFVIPALLDSQASLPMLDHLQAVNLEDPDGLAALAETLQQDWQRRRELTSGASAASGQ